jgi:two-component system invasion response regulator UvrY
MKRILLVDDHVVVREGLKQIVADIPDLFVAGEAGTAQEALQKALSEKYDLIILDITMPGASGLDILKDLTTQKPGSKILVLSMHPEERYALRVLKAGAMGYVTKDRAPTELIEAVQTVLQGRRYVGPSLAEKLATDKVFTDERPAYMVLSDREYSVMLMIASGKTMTDIAKELSLSIKTVSSYRRRILVKMKKTNNADLVRYVIENQLLN